MNQPHSAQDPSGLPAVKPSREFQWQSRDGLTLSGCEWLPGSNTDTTRPTILCLPGLSRNTRDFRDIATFLQEKGYRVIALDYRGRGKSDWDPVWQNYSIPIEGHDIDDAIVHLGLERFAIIGTSRGGLHAMAMSHRYAPEQFVGVVLNDIGPHIEMKAIHRISASIGRNMTYPDAETLARYLAHVLEAQFPDFGASDWLKLTYQLASNKDGKFVFDYDPAIVRAFAITDEAAPLPDLWPLYDGLKYIPVLAIRGEMSDLLSAETCTEMLARHHGAESWVVTGQGHAPMLWDEPTQTKIAGFLDRL